MAIVNYLVTHALQTVLFSVVQKKGSHTGLERIEGE